VRICRLNLALDLESCEQRDGFVVVDLELAQIVRHDPFHELAGFRVNVRIVDEDLANLVGEMVADGTDDRVAFLVDQKRCRAAYDDGPDCLPNTQ